MYLAYLKKLVYLQQALKGRTAQSTIEVLSCSGEYYAESVTYLQARYNSSIHLIHQTHGHMVLEAQQCVGVRKEMR